MANKPSARFRALLKSPELLVMPGGFSPLHARMAEALGYEAFFMAGSQIAAYLYGYPDVGLIGVGE
ncbi:MAG TPA: carboxyvinyl-carboxyphosphonate phosphorylmutase, partial [Candidatus Binatia bacterium]